MMNQEFYQPGFMDLSAYKLESVPLGLAWDRLVESSDQGSLFCLSTYLKNLHGARPRSWCCSKGQEAKAVLVVMESEDGKDCMYEGFAVHTGIMLLSAPSGQSNAQTIAENFRIISFIVNELTRNYENVFISTHPKFPDIRPFLWHNYGDEGPKFEVDVRYTSVLSLAGIEADGLPEHNPVYGSSSKSRRQEIRYGMRKGVETSCESAVGDFLKLYGRTFARQSQQIDDQEYRKLEQLVQGLMTEGLARMYMSRTAAGDVGSIAVFGIYRECAYYLFGANDPDIRDQHTGTMVIWDALLDLARSGVKEVDLEGVNSPLRGHFKLSFGGTLTPYYHLYLRNT